MNVASKISDYFLPVREKRLVLENNKNHVLEILIEGEKKARIIAENTMKEVRESMKLG